MSFLFRKHLMVRALFVLLSLALLSACASTKVASTDLGRTAPGPIAESSPSFSLDVYEGQLLGSDGGEWGGALTFVDKAGVPSKLLEENVVGMFPVSSEVLVFTGIAHLTINRGAIYKVGRTAEGKVESRLLVRLAGWPQGLKRIPGGEIVFSVYSGKFEKRTKNYQPVFVCQILGVDQQLHPCPEVEAP